MVEFFLIILALLVLEETRNWALILLGLFALYAFIV
jgi:hypothetical protein